MKIFMVSAFAFSLLLAFACIYVSLKGLKGQGNDFTGVKDWISRDRWQGQLTEGKLLSWKQTNAMHNFDYFFIFTVEANIEGQPKQYKAATAVKVSEIPFLTEGAPVVIKYSGVPPKKITIMDIQVE